MTVALYAKLAFVGLAAFSAYGFVHAARKDERRASCTALCALQPAYAGRSLRAPDFALPDLDGRAVRLSDFRGKTVILNFWTKSCGPCLEELPSLAELARVARTESDLVVLTVSTDDSAAEAREALAAVLPGEIPFAVLMDPEAKVVTERFGTRLYPETWLLDPEGIVRARFDGARDWSSSLVLETARGLARPSGCPVEVQGGEAQGPFAELCDPDAT